MGKYKKPPAIPKMTPCNAMRSRILKFGENTVVDIMKHSIPD